MNRRDVLASLGGLAAARVNVRIARHWLRVSPSVYNDMDDIERLLGALA